ncbi:MAG TPA: non-ribosomal peptide synthase/polyketide synthase [Pyrinomonadaceae bacterium]|nr:non-ribosomal peptide synthase/polyketide synthase [Pyrinomonadaceae bacterium]
MSSPTSLFFNSLSDRSGQPATLIELLRWRAREKSDEVGYIFLADGETQELSLTYGELDRRARAIAAQLQRSTVRGDRALLLYPPGLDYVAAFFGCLYAGVIAVPAYPPDPSRFSRSLPRLQTIVADSRASVTLTTETIRTRASLLIDESPLLHSLNWMSFDEPEIGLEAEWHESPGSSNELAFLQYTSGSTGAPKGVMLSHENLLHNASLVYHGVEHTNSDKYVSWLPTFHDMGFMAGILQPLYAGIPVVSMSPVAFLQRPLLWLQAISRYQATTSGGPNFAYDLCTRKITPEQRAELDLSRWSVAFNGAEPIRQETLDSFAETFASCGFRREAFYPCYGLAEATLIVTGSAKSQPPVVKLVDTEALEKHLGVDASNEQTQARPLVGCGHVLLDQEVAIVHPEKLTRCAPGEIGEIWVSGASVAQGYWDKPEESEQTFHAYLLDTGAGPFLRTGDLGFVGGLSRGELYVTGRLKDLIIIRGLNHYPQDVELSVERSHPSLRAGCGAAFAIEVENEERLVIVQEIDYRKEPDVNVVFDGIRTAVAAEHELQVYAIALIKAGRIPKTTSGKIQRRASRAAFLAGKLDLIAEWRADAPTTTTPLSVETPVRKQTAGSVIAWLIMQMAARPGVVLHDLDVNQPIARYGLDSLAAIELMHKIETDLGVLLPMTAFLQTYSIAELATLIAERQEAAASAPAPSPEQLAVYPLSYGQRALWFLHQLAPESPVYNIAAAVKIEAAINVAQFRSGFEKIVERHPALRTIFSVVGSEPVQRVREDRAFDFHEQDAAEWSDALLRERLVQDANRPFDLEHGPLLRVYLYRRSTEEHLLLLVVHHIVADFWSLAIVLRELAECYSSARSGKQILLTHPSASYSDYVRSQMQTLASNEGERLWTYWQKQLTNVPYALDLPVDRHRPPVQTYRGGSCAFKLEAELTMRIRELAQQHGATLYMTLLAAFQVLLHRYTNQDLFLVGSPTAGRSRAGLADVVGYFVNPIALLADFSQDPAFAGHLDRVRQHVLEAFEHQEFPFPLLVERLQPERDPSRSPLFQAVFALQKTHATAGEHLSPFALGESGARFDLGGLPLETVALDERVAQFDLTLMMSEENDALAASLQYNADLFDPQTIERMATHFRMLLEAIVSDPDRPVSALSILPKPELQQVLVEWNETDSEFTGSCVHSLFEAQAEQTPDAVAVVCGHQSSTYRELNAHANQLARYLRRVGVGPEVTVGILMERSIAMVVSILAVLKADGAYLPLDPANAHERLTFMLRDSSTPVLLTQQAQGFMPDHGVNVFCLDSDWPSIAEEDESNLDSTVAAANLAYVIYTSGSTGQPKGVEIPHSGLANLVVWHRRAYGVTSGDRATQLAGPAFDASVWELWPYLTSGASIYIPDEETRVAPFKLLQWLADNAITICFLPTPLAEAVIQETLPSSLSLRAILTGGDVLHRRPSAALPFMLVNHYGPTENTVVTTRSLVTPEGDAAPPIGSPIANTHCFLLNKHLQPVPVGVAGELFISGLGLARGYHDRPELTAEKFLPNPFSFEPGARLYRTGDLARYLPDGQIEFLGRLDYQVKVRGFRIELGEIESVLRHHPDVGEAVVVAWEDGPGNTRLAAYVVPASEWTTSGQLQSFLREKLPEYMVPASFLFLGELPITANGKIDRAALPAPAEFVSPLSESSTQLRTPMEELVAGIWCRVLGVDKVGGNDNFFELGGHSLLATQVTSRIRETLNVDISLRSLFVAPTLAALAEQVGKELDFEDRSQLPSLAPVLRDHDLPLSFAQQRLWFLDQLEPGNSLYSIPAALRLSGRLDPALLQEALDEITRRHESLRTVFKVVKGEPVQVIAAPQRLPLSIVDLRESSATERARRANVHMSAHMIEEMRKPFDLTAGPLMRAVLLQLDETEYVLLLNMHHIVSDGWSLGVLLRELTTLYGAYVAGETSLLPELPIQYADFAHWQREWLSGETLDKQLEYWRKQLAGAPLLPQLPADRVRPAVQTFRGARVQQEWSEELRQQLKSLSQQEGVTLFMTLLAAFQVVLARWSGQDEVVVGTPIAGRTQVETEPLIGFFVNTLVMRTSVNGNPSVRELLQRVREMCLQAYAHQDVPFEKLVEELQPERNLSHSPLFQVMFAQQDLSLQLLSMNDVEIAMVESDTSTSKFDLTLFVSEAEQGLVGSVEYSTDLFDESTIRRLFQHYTHLLEALVSSNPEQPLSALSMLSVSEQQQILHDWNQTASDYPRERLLHQWFEAQVERTPEATALVCGEERLTYAELNRQANQLGHRLRALGVGTESRVGVMLERTPLLLTGLLAVLKAGGAYVPLDPNYPQQRVSFMLADAEVQVLLTTSELAETVATGDLPVLCLDRENGEASSENLDCAVQAENLSYVIYTSGSTGIPKGVAITHGNASAFLHWAINFFSPEKLQAVLASTSINFDLSVFELFAPLSVGGSVILAENALHLAAIPAASRVELINTVPSAMAELVRQRAVPPSVRVVNLAGEALSRKLVQEIYALGAVEQVVNLYGPSEDTTYSTYEAVASGVNDAVLIGRPIDNTQVYLLDAEMQPAPVGVAGELYIAGDGLARGYLNRAALTAERFVPNPFTAQAGARLYRTGDLARYRDDGRIEYLGRMDQQVKIRGFRIELGEIEAQLERHAMVRQAVVTANDDGDGGKRLVAYLVTQIGETIATSELRGLLKEQLPEYMVPSAFVHLAELPLTANGKVDRKRLPAAEFSRDEMAVEFVAPRTPAEEAVAGIWAEVLKLERVGVFDNFFELGGHSLLATQVISRLRESFQTELTLRSLFEEPTVMALAARIENSLKDHSELPPAMQPVARDKNLELSFTQQRLWFLDQLEPGSAFYNIAAAVQLDGELNVAALKKSFDEVVRRHEALRTRFIAIDGSPFQIIEEHLSFTPDEIDLSALPAAERQNEARRLAAEEAQRPFDLAHGPLLRAGLIKLSETEHVLLVTMHHIVGDGWSIGVLIQELAALYPAFSNGGSSPLPELPIQYADFANWQRQWLAGPTLQKQIDYWLNHLADAPAMLELPADRPRPAVQSRRGATESFNLPATLSESLKAFSRTEGVTLFTTLMAALQTLLLRYTGQQDFMIGSPIANRNHLETEKLVGCFTNTLVLRANLAGNPKFRELVKRVWETTLGAHAHQDVPFERLVEELQPERDLGRSPLFQVMFVLQNASSESGLNLPGLNIQLLETDSATARFDLTLSMSETASGLNGALEYNTDLFDASTIRRLLQHFTNLLQAITEDGADQPLSILPLLDSSERAQLLDDWNATACDYPAARLLHQWFEHQVERTPDSVALIFAEERISYQELNTRANRLAHHLLSLRVGPETKVGIMLERTPLMLVSLLAVLKASGTYVPLDPNYPQQRIAFMIQDADIQVLLTESHLSERLPENSAAIVVLDREWSTIAAADENPTATAQPDNLAYAIYTSGSTGTPKGVAIAHRNASAFLHWSNQFFTAEKLSMVLASTSINFDLSVFELFAPLSCGGCVVLADNALQLPSLSSGVGLINTVPSAIAELVRQRAVPQSARTINLAGEALSRKLVQDIYALGTVDEVINLYGPSEDTTYTTYETVAGDIADAPVPIGRPIGNTQVYLLDHELQPVPIGVAGEFYTAGDGLARGYLNRPELTAQRFIPNPFSSTPGSRLYGTGDLARYRADGRIEYLGRMDQQVKIRGFRIELGEIEAVLERHPMVQRCVVTANTNDVGDKRLVAYVVPEEQTAAGELRAHLKEKLPDYMVPSYFVMLAEMPLTPNGKVDRKRLPAPEQTRSESETGYVAPRTQTEGTVAKIWAEVLRIERVGVEDNFFESGGHSLLATQVVSRLRAAFQTEAPLRWLFEAPTCAALAAYIDTAIDAQTTLTLPPLQHRDPAHAAQLSFTQQRLWFLDQLEPGSAFYNIGAAVRIEGKLNVTALEQSFQELTKRHESLRTRFVVVDGAPVQMIDPATAWELPITDLTQTPESDAEFQRLASDATRRPFDLTRGPLLHPHLFRLDRDEHVLLVTMHHIISDGWSIRVLMREIAVLVEAFSQEKPSPLPELPVQFADFAQWQRQCLQGELLETQLAYWKQRLAGAPLLLELPLDKPRPAVQTYAGARQSLLLAEALSDEIKSLGKTEGHTLFVVLLAAFKALLHRYTNQTDIVIGSPIAGRNHLETEGLIGFFANTLVLRTMVNGDPTFVELARRVREGVVEAQAHQDVPFERLVEELQVTRDLSRSPLFQVMFILQNAAQEEMNISGLTLTPMEIDSGTSKFDLTFFVDETNEGLRGTLEYNTDLFEAATVNRLLRHFRILLESIVANSGSRLSELPLLNDGERQQLLVEWNETYAAYDDAACVHQLFEAQVERTPEAIALVCGEERLTYAELNRRANQLGHRLRALGVGAESRVGVMLERTPLLLTGLLAVLKAGGAYVPLDPNYPQQRVSFMLADAEVQVLLTTSELAETVATGEVPVLCLDRDADEASSENLDCAVHAENLSYVIYTSGSTGIPKGVQIPHRAVVNFLSFMQKQLSVTGQDILLAVTSLSFDIAVLELFMPLLTGARVVLLTREQTMDAAMLSEQLSTSKATLMQATPATWRMLSESGWKAESPLKVLCGGEALSRELAHQLANSGAELWNLYGPTETTVWSLTTRIEADEKRITIGRPMANTQVYVVDKQLRPVPVNVPGELYIGGDGLARGYLKRPDLTAERFVPNPFRDQEGARLYRTGDLVRYRDDGNIEYLGRIDQQVKIRGFRIELGEIEAQLERHAQIRQAVVTANDDAGGDKRLVAYLVTQAGETVATSELRSFLKEQLPEYMVPSAFVHLAELPLTANGKVDRKRLPAAEFNRDEMTVEFVAPRTPAEETVAGIWAAVLKVERVGVLDNFFELGGHSLLATQVMHSLRETFHVELPLRSIFESPTVSDLSHIIEKAGSNGSGAIKRLSRERYRVKIPAQELVTNPEPLRNSADV